MKFIKLGFVFVLTLTWTTINFVAQKALDDVNETLTVALQQNLKSSFTDFVMNTASKILVIAPILYIVFSFVVSGAESKLDFFFTFFQIILSTFLNTAAKLIVRENRPFFERDAIQAYSCECNYAMPSGHANMIGIGVLCFVDVYLRKKAREEEKVPGIDKKVGIGILALVLFLIVCVSRVYFGVHTFSQVIMGALFAALIFVVTDEFRPNIRQVFYKRRKTTVRLKSQIWSFTINVFLLLSLFSLFSNLLLTQIPESEFNSQTLKNMSKCPHCKKGLRNDTISGILSLYCLPGLFVVVVYLTSMAPQELNSIRNESSPLKRRATFVGCLVLSLIIVPVFISVKNKLDSLFIQLVVYCLLTCLPLITLVLPVYILNKLRLDQDQDYISFSLKNDFLSKDGEKISSISQGLVVEELDFDEKNEDLEDL